MKNSSLTRRLLETSESIDGGDESDFFAYGISFHQQRSHRKNPCLSQVRGERKSIRLGAGDGEALRNNDSEQYRDYKQLERLTRVTGK